MTETIAEYNNEVFDVSTLEEAVDIIVTGTPELSSRDRWELETPHLLDLIAKNVPNLGEKSWILDYGCGIGRLAKPLIETYGCYVVGIDTSASMRLLGMHYVNSDHYLALSPKALRELQMKRADPFWHNHDAAIAVWSIQHCLYPEEDLLRIFSALRLGGRFFIVNDHRRKVPVELAEDGRRRWIDDGQNVKRMIPGRPKEEGHLNEVIVSKPVAENGYWACYQKGLKMRLTEALYRKREF